MPNAAHTTTPALVTVRGHAADAAVFSITPTAPHEGRLSVLIHTGLGLPVLVVQRVGSSAAAHIAAAAKAAAIRAGQAVEAYGTGLQPQHDHGHARIRLMGVTGVMPLNHQQHTITEVDHHATH